MTTRSQVPALVASHSVFNANGTLYAKIVNDFYAVFSYGEHFPVAIHRRSVDEALAYAESVFRRTGIILSLEAL